MDSTDQDRRDFVGWVANQLLEGRSRDEVVHQLTAEGIDSGEANRIVAGIETSLRKAQRKHKWKASMLGWIGLLVVFGLLNGVLYLGQELYHRGDVKTAESIKAEFDVLDAKITHMETELGQVESLRQRLDELKRKLADPDAYYTTQTTYDSEMEEYKALVGRWNASLPQMSKLANDYDQTVAEYNHRVESYNKIAKKAYSRWWLLPIPGGRHAEVAPRARNQ